MNLNYKFGDEIVIKIGRNKYRPAIFYSYCKDDPERYANIRFVSSKTVRPVSLAVIILKSIYLSPLYEALKED